MSSSRPSGWWISSLFGRDRIGYERAKPDGRDRAGSIVERDLRIAKRIGGRHAHTPLSEAGRHLNPRTGPLSVGFVLLAVSHSSLRKHTARRILANGEIPYPNWSRL